MASRYYWTAEVLSRARQLCRESSKCSEATDMLSGELGIQVTPNALQIALRRSEGPCAADLLGTQVVGDVYLPGFDVIGESPYNSAEYKEALKDGYHSMLTGSVDLSVATYTEPEIDTLIDAGLTNILPDPGSWSVFALWSDLHIGSDDCNETAIREFQKYAYEMGARDFLCAGDFIDGSYSGRGGQHEQRYIGLDEQIKATLDLLDQKPGMRHWIISGNHEATFFKQAGVDAGVVLSNAAVRVGRSDINFIGSGGGRVSLRGIDFELTHYKRGVRRAPLSHFQSKRDCDVPDVLIGGHYHILDITQVRDCLCIQPAAFQRETSFMMGSEFHPTGGVLLYVHHAPGGNRYLTEFVEYDKVE